MDRTAESAKLREEVINLRRALQTRDVIGQAKGVLIARTGCNADEAFSLLSHQSQRENRKVVEVAAEIVERAIRRAHDLPQPPNGHSAP